MNRFEVVAPRDLAHAIELLLRPGHAALAGGVDTIDLMKQGIAAPTVLVNLKGIDELGGIKKTSDGGISIGALVHLSEVAEHDDIRRDFTAVAEAAEQAATPQIRNLGTVGGNLLQRPRCWYFRNPLVNCLKKGGTKCYALGGLNRYHSILSGGPSYIVHPSNLAPALIALGARLRIMSAKGEKVVSLEAFFALPTVDPTRENLLAPGEIVVSVLLPPTRDVSSTYMEIREKQSFDWPLVSVAAALRGGRKPRQVAIVLGAVAPVPWRAVEAEKRLNGQDLNPNIVAAAAEAAMAEAQPMSDNGYKVTIAKVIIRRAVLKAAGIESV